MSSDADSYTDHVCPDCKDDLVQVEGEWYCQDCGPVGDPFELVPDRESFEL